MFVIDLQYSAPLEQVNDVLAEHVAFLEEHYATGVFIASGRKVPRTGGIILARAANRDELAAIIAKDPFKQRGVAAYEVTEFVASMTAPEVAILREG